MFLTYFQRYVGIVGMKLEHYLDTYQLTRGKFAELLGVSGQAVDNWINGKRYPRGRTAGRILDITKGEVTPNDFYPLTQSKQKVKKNKRRGE